MGPRGTRSFLSGFFAVTLLRFPHVGACVIPVSRYMFCGNGEQSGKAGAQGRGGGRESRAGVPLDDVGSSHTSAAIRGLPKAAALAYTVTPSYCRLLFCVYKPSYRSLVRWEVTKGGLSLPQSSGTLSYNKELLGEAEVTCVSAFHLITDCISLSLLRRVTPD